MIGCHHLFALKNRDCGLADVRKVVPKRSQWKMIEQNETKQKGSKLALPGNYLNIGNTTMRYEAGPGVQACNKWR